MSLSLSKNDIWDLATYIQMEEEFCPFKSSKDFMIAEILIKPSKKFKACFSSTFTQAGSGTSQTSKIELFAEIFECFELLTIFAETFILDVWLDSKFYDKKSAKPDLGKDI